MAALRLTVALPVRNGENFIREAIDSILAQSFADFELVVADNASQDGTADIVREYAARDPRVRHERGEEMLPIGGNMNRAVTLARGEWVKLFCHDDLMRADCLAQIDRAIEDHGDSNVAIIGNNENHLMPDLFLTENQSGQASVFYNGKDAARQHLNGTRKYLMPAVTSATVRKSAFMALGQFDTRFVHFDHFLWLRIMVRHDFVYLPDTLTTTRVHPAQITHSSRKSLGWLNEYRTFIDEYLAEHGAALELSWAADKRARAIPLSVAAKSILGELDLGNWSGAGEMFGKLPLAWKPVMPALILRSWLQQRRARPAMAAGKS